MNSKDERNTGLSLMISSVLIVTTMVLHPVGGDFDHLLQIATIGMIAHSIGILSIPFAAYGYWGIMNRLDEVSFLSRIAFSFMLFGLVAVMIAATLNGLVITQLAQSYAGASEETIASLKPIFRYSHAFNLANDYIYMTAVAISTLCWSIAMLMTKKFAAWLAYLGIGLVLVAVSSVFLGYIFTTVTGFSIFIFGSAVWTIGMGWSLWRSS
ncbi:MAG: hypothetical protein RIC80_01840 [Cyclobacteriaceae bacterium]